MGYNMSMGNNYYKIGNLFICIFRTMITDVPFCIIKFLVIIESKILSNWAKVLFSLLIGINYLLT